MSLLLISLLLFMAGVELNPGPNYPCHECTKVFSSVQQYFTHQKENHASIPCCFKPCFGRFITLSAFQSHVTRNHHQTSQVSTCFQCPISNCSLPTRGSTLKEHLEEHLEGGEQFTCPYGDSCKTIHKQKGSFRVHLSRKHPQKPSRENQLPTMQPSGSSKPSQSSDGSTTEDQSTSHSSEIVCQVCPPSATNVIKNNVIKFYLQLEGLKVLPSSTVQFISENIAKFTNMSHQCMIATLEKLLTSAGIEKRQSELIIHSTFKADPVYNIHHINEDPEQVSTIHFRKKEMKMRSPFVPSIEVSLPIPNMQGKARAAQYVPLKETLEVLCADVHIKKEILKSFSRVSNPHVLQDFCDGSAFKKHLEQHAHHKCIQIILFQDAFEYNPFGPAKGLYKTTGWYYVVGNLPPEYRSKLEMIMLIFLVQEHYLKPSLQELLHLFNKQEEALATLITDFQQLKSPGILIDGTSYPVCLIIMTGDNLGQHQIGGYVQSFSGEYWCRYCPISKTEFHESPHMCKPFRSEADYEDCVSKARNTFLKVKRKSLCAQEKKKTKALADKAVGKDVVVPKSVISKSARGKLQSVHHLGIKPLPSALNKIPGFHVNLSMAPCLAHDLFEGVVNDVLTKILQKLVAKNWFDLPTLNRHIVGFKCKGQDTLDSPTAIKSFEGIKGHACETWTLLRLLPLMLDELVKDPEDDHWLLYLKLKQLCEYICAPKISLVQINHLHSLIVEYLCSVKQLLPSCLTPKHHYLAHYPELIKIFGPLIRLFTLRFESKHVFFKKVARTCKSFVNITKTLSSKYQYKFACDHLDGFLPDELEYEEAEELLVALPGAPPIPPNDAKVKIAKKITFKGSNYETGMWMIVNKLNLIDLHVGSITKILIYPGQEIYFELRIHEALYSGNGYYVIDLSASTSKVIKLSNLPDYFPLSSYRIVNNNRQLECLSLKHTVIFM